MASPEALNQQYGIPNLATFSVGKGDLPCLEVTTPAATGRVYLHGAHVASWVPAGHEEVMFLSADSAFVPGKPIRGGVPVCFPWFGPRAGDPTAPLHGFARIREWNVESVRKEGDAVTVTLVLHGDEQSRTHWPVRFELRHRITFGRTLRMELEFRNLGDAEVTFEEALHTYLAVADVRSVRVLGLDQTQYIDKTDAMQRKTQSGPVTITAETDRVYTATPATTVVQDPGLRRQIAIEKENSQATVVWNPWVAKAKAMPDFGDQEWPAMICVETCNVGENAAKVAPGGTHRMAAVLRVENM